jgi:hypothetical protein
MEIERAGKQNTAQELFRVKVVEPLMKCVA